MGGTFHMDDNKPEKNEEAEVHHIYTSAIPYSSSWSRERSAISLRAAFFFSH